MLPEEQNRMLMEVGPGTPMGELLRRYWQPIAAVDEFEDKATKVVRLMGEDLVLYKDLSGTYGLVDLHCPHRRADLSYGIVEQCGLRCNYHGWQFDETGRCIAQPYEEVARPDAHYKDRITIKAYPVEAKAGLLWAYLGPAPAPLLPDWDAFYQHGYKQIVFTHITCNWFQCQENSIDPVHFEWLHSNWSIVLKGEQDTGYSPTHTRVGFEEFDYGFTYKRIRADTTDQDELWTVGRVCLWPNALYTGHFEWRVPIDDENTLSVAWINSPLPGNEYYHQERIPSWWSPLKDAETGRWINSHTMNQDFIAWVGQGTMADRTQEHLGESDRGVIAMRRKFFDQMALIADGGEPYALIRDPEQNHAVYLPRTGRDNPGQIPPQFAARLRLGGSAGTLLYGQPQWIVNEMAAAYDERAARLSPAADD